MRTTGMYGQIAVAMFVLTGCVAPNGAPDQTGKAGVSPAKQTDAVPVAAAATAPAPAVRTMERPTNAVGDVCYYERTIGYKKMRETRTLSTLTADKMIWDIQTDTGIKGVYEVTLADEAYLTARDVSWANGQDVTFAPAYKWMAFPASPGQSWSVKADIKGQTFAGAIEDEVKMDAWEKVKVPAGEFSAMRTTLKGAYWDAPRKGVNPNVKGTLTVWSSPETKCFIVQLKYSNSVGEKGSAKLIGSS